MNLSINNDHLSTTALFLIPKGLKYSQTWVNDHLWIATTVLRFQLQLLLHSRPLNNDHLAPVFNGHCFCAPVVHKFECTLIVYHFLRNDKTEKKTKVLITKLSYNELYGELGNLFVITVKIIVL